MIAGPERPPYVLPRNGPDRSRRSAIPESVLIAESASAPASAIATAIGRMSATLGESLTMSGSSVARRTARVTAAAASWSIANWSPPFPTFGQLMFSSTPAIPGTRSSFRTTWT